MTLECVVRGLSFVALAALLGCGGGGGSSSDDGSNLAQDTGQGRADVAETDAAEADTAEADARIETDTAEADTSAEADVPESPDVGDEDTSDAPPQCEGENAVGDLPEGIEWLILDGNSEDRFGFSDSVFSMAAEGDFGVYDINTLEVYGANGFKIDSPMTVYAAQARWTNLPARGEAPATLRAWPDFGANGFSFDVNAELGRYTRCLGAEDAGEWVTYTFPEAIEVQHPVHVWVGYHRPEAVNDTGEPAYLWPELMMEDFSNEEEPFYSGAQFPDYDDEQLYGGLSTPWFTWQVRLGVIRHDDVAPEDKPFQIIEDAPSGSRSAWGDFDNDGDDDLMVSGPRLFENDGAGTFTNITDEALPGGTAHGSNGGVWGDYDNDGCLDYFGQGGADTLLHNNCDGTFTDVTEGSGISDVQTLRDCNGDGEPEPSPTEGSGWVDLNGDGFLDLYLANYECSSEFDSYRNYRDRFFTNQGDGTFVETSEQVGVESATQAGRGVTIIDFDRDGDTDIYVSNYRLDANFHYINQGDGTMVERSFALGTQGDSIQRAYGHTIGSVFGDIDNDGDFDLINANLAHPRFYQFSDLSRVLVQQRDGTFDNRERGLIFRETHSNPVLFDADNDGDLDLFITNVYAGRDSDFYTNDGAGRFALQNYASGLVVQNGWGAAAADIDNDGDLDLATNTLMFRNLTDARETRWLQVRAVGVDGVNASAIGAVIEVEAGGQTQLRAVSGGSGTACQDSFVQHFGLAPEVETIDRVTVFFPYGPEVTIEGAQANQRLWIYSDNEVGTGFAPPDRP